VPKDRIFKKAQLTPGQLFAVADRRFDDALYLCRSKENARANGAMYIAGFVIECCLKAWLLRTYRWLGNAAFPEQRSDEDKHLWRLCYRSHNLDEIAAHLPNVTARLESRDQLGARSLVATLKSVCSWSIFARYSPQAENIRAAEQFVGQVRELKKWLSGVA
jgi:hypothetical protein